MKLRSFPAKSLISLTAAGSLAFAIGWRQGPDPISRLEVLLCNPLLNQLEMENTWAAARAVGARGIEVHVEPDLSCSNLYLGGETPYRLDTQENAWKLRTDAIRNEIRIPVLVAPIRLDPAEAKTTGAPPWAMTLLENAPHVDAELVYFPIVTDNFLETTISDDEFVEAAVFVLNDLVGQGARHRISVGIENLSVYWNRPEILRQVLGQFDPDELGLCLDPINFYWYGHPRSVVYEMVEEFLPRTIHFHAKNLGYPPDSVETRRTPGWRYGEHAVPVADGDLDFERFIRQLLDSGYEGYISVEDDSLGRVPVEQRLDVLKADVAFLHRVIQGFLGRPGS